MMTLHALKRVHCQRVSCDQTDNKGLGSNQNSSRVGVRVLYDQEYDDVTSDVYVCVLIVGGEESAATSEGVGLIPFLHRERSSAHPKLQVLSFSGGEKVRQIRYRLKMD
ncbi:hypothetical protein QTP88_022275 [Uroleucon formosanum]